MLEIVAAQTGYPTEMLDMDLDLEADLGIDTVKQAEMFATIREALRDRARRRAEAARLPDAATTWSAFVDDRARDTGRDARRPTRPTAEPAAEPEPRATPTASRGACRCPSAAAARQCVPTGVELGRGSRVVVMRRPAAASARRSPRGSQARRRGADDRRRADAEELEHAARALAADGPIDGVYWLPALDDEGPLADLDPADWRDGLHLRVKLPRRAHARR